MEYLAMSILALFGLLVGAYFQNPTLRRKVDKAILRSFWMGRFKASLEKEKALEKECAEKLTAQQEQTAIFFERANGKPFKRGGGKDKPEEKGLKRLTNPNTRQLALIALLLETNPIDKMDCWPELAAMLSNEAESRLKQHGWTVETSVTGMAHVSKKENGVWQSLWEIDTNTGAVRRIASNPRITSNVVAPVQAAPRRAMTPDEINAEIAAATQYTNEPYQSY